MHVETVRPTEGITMNVQFDPSRAGTAISGTHHHGHRGGRDISGLAKRLGVDASDLETARKNGQSLSDFAESKGISQDDLLSAVKAEITAHRPDGAPALSDDQLTAIATRMVDATPRRRQAPPVQEASMPSPSVLDALQQVKTSDGSSLADLLSNLQVTDQDGGTTTGLDEVLKLLQGQGNTYGADGSADLGTSLGVDAAA
jgi:hypothetical protein